MPRGFLVKRTNHTGQFSHRLRHFSDEDRSESGSDQEYVQTNFGSPDSGYSASPVFASFRERYGTYNVLGKSSPASSPLTIHPYSFPSPQYYTKFDTLSVCNDVPLDLKIYKTPEKQNKEQPIDFSNAQPQSLSPPELPKKLPTSTFSPATPISPNKRRGNTDATENKPKSIKKPKAARKINFDEDNSSPVSGTIIRKLNDDIEGARIVCGDIDSKFNCVEVTPEAKAELAKIENHIGDYVCRLCKDVFEDAFQLAQHRCSMIINIEYRCPECDKVFNCPANLASHRRWHKPRPNAKKPSAAVTPMKILPASTANTLVDAHQQEQQQQQPQQQRCPLAIPASLGVALERGTNSKAHSPREQNQNDGRQFPCIQCGKTFKRQAYLRKHQLTHDAESIYVCQYCSKIFPHDNARAKHEQTHTTGKELTCTLCNTSFPNKIVLEKHVRQHGNDKFDCKYCDNSFCSSPGLTRHINKCHPSENRQVILLQIPGNRNC